jgi:hypothetical protein
MDVIPIRPDFEKVDFVALANLLTGLFQLAIYGFAEDHSPILGRTDKVVHQHGNVMTLVNVLAHSLTIAQQAAGN